MIPVTFHKKTVERFLATLGGDARTGLEKPEDD